MRPSDSAGSWPWAPLYSAWCPWQRAVTFPATHPPMHVNSAVSSFVTAQDGLRLHVCSYGPSSTPALPVICLPGLARTVADFEILATALAGDAKAPRRVIALDARGRGRSDYDRNPA